MDIRYFSPNAQEIFLEKGRYFYDPDMNPEPKVAYYITDGIAAIKNTDPGGNSRIISLLYAPRFLLCFPLIHNDTYAGCGNQGIRIFPNVAFTALKGYKIAAGDFLRRYQTDEELHSLIEKQIYNDYEKLLQKMASISSDSVSTRLCRYLLQNASRDRDGILKVEHFMTYRDLASYICTHEVTVAKLMGKLMNYKYVKREGSSLLLLNPDGLQTLIDTYANIPYS